MTCGNSLPRRPPRTTPTSDSNPALRLARADSGKLGLLKDRPCWTQSTPHMPKVSEFAPRLPDSAKPKQVTQLVFRCVRFKQAPIWTSQLSKRTLNEALG